MIKQLKYLLFLSFIISAKAGMTQWGDCSNSIDACTNPSFSVTPSGFGNIEEFTSASNISNPQTNPNPAPGNMGCLLSGELNSTWLLITISGGGTLEFSMGTAGSFNCFDWIMWPYDPNLTCTEIQNNNWAPIACNWNGACTGITGMANPGNIPAGGDPSDFENPLTVNAGDQFMLCFSNFSGSTTSVPLDFFGTATATCGSVIGATICEGDTASIYVIDGTSYSWTTTTPGFIGTNATGDTAYVNPTVTTEYIVEISFNGGNTITDTALVEVIPAIAPTAVTVVETCIGDSNGTITINPTNGAAPFEYIMSGPMADTNSTGQFTGLTGGTYVIDVSDFNGCSDQITVILDDGPLCCDIELTINGDTVSCLQDCSGMLTVDTAFTHPPVTFQWYDSNMNLLPNSNNDTITGLCAGMYYVSATDIVCTEYDSVEVIIDLNLPVVSGSNDTTIAADQSIVLWVTGGDIYNWTPDDYLDCSDCDTVFATPAQDITYIVHVVDSLGCPNYDTINVTVEYFPLFIPNGFSPNNDNQNDMLFVRGGGVVDIDFRVFDKWGTMVFQSRSLDEGWDGTHKNVPLNTGVYLYTLKAITNDLREINMTGNVTLFR